MTAQLELIFQYIIVFLAVDVPGLNRGLLHNCQVTLKLSSYVILMVGVKYYGYGEYITPQQGQITRFL